MGSPAATTLSDDVVHWFTDPGARQDPYAFFDRLRDEDPVHYNEQLKTWVVTRYDDGDTVFRGSPVVRNPADFDISYMLDEQGELRPTWRLDRGTHRWHDGEDLNRIRRLVSQVMGARQIRSWRGQAQEVLDQHVERVVGLGEADLIEEFVFELPMQMICRIFGVPTSDRENYRKWTEDWFSAVVFVTDPEVQAKGDAAAIAFEEHIGELVKHKRDHPDESLLSLLIQARDSGDKLRDDELVAMTASMLGAGHETTGSLVGNATLALLRNPEQMALLREDPSRAKDAVEETLRYEGSAMLTPRFVAEDFELRGRTIAAGDMIQILLQATGRSPITFDDPHRFWIDRPSKRHLGFALGPHFCCGAQLARLEAELMVTAVATRFPNLEMTTDEVTWKPILGIRGLKALPVRWG
jgi:cytochrome P450